MDKTVKMRTVILILAAALVILTVACIFWTPYDPSRLLRPVPANAAVITLHGNLGPRLGSLATNAFIRPLLGSEDGFLPQLEKRGRLLKILAARSTALAFIPDFDRFTEHGAPRSAPALAVTSWVGAWTPLLRWALWARPPRDILPAGSYNGHRLWAVRRPISFCGSSAYFSFTLDEGRFIGCLAREGNGVARLLRTDERRGDAIPAEAAARPLLENKALDRAVFKIELPGAKNGRPVYALGTLDALDNDRLSAAVTIKTNIRTGLDGIPAAAMAAAEKICGRGPVILACAPSGLAVESINALAGAQWQNALRPLVVPQVANNGACLLAVFTGEGGGRFGAEPLRIAVPTLLLAVSGLRPDQARAAFPDLLGLVNARYRLALAVNKSLPPAGSWQLYGIEPAAGKLLRSMPPDDLPAYAFYGDWLMLASNGAGLRKILLEMESGARPAAEAWPRFPDGKRKQAFVRIDPVEGGKALRFGLMLAAIGLGEGANSPAQQTTLSILKSARTWLEGLDAMRDASAWLENRNGETVLRIEIAGNGMKK